MQRDNIQPWWTPFPILNPFVVPCLILTVASWPACRFLRRQETWSGIPISLRFFQFVVIHTVKDFNIVSEAEVVVVVVFSGYFLAFSMIQWMLTIWSVVPLPFLNPSWISGSSRFMYCWSLAWRILSITLLACEMNTIVQYFEHSLALPFFVIAMKTDLFQSCSHCWVF